jgi:hypothetical protein
VNTSAGIVFVIATKQLSAIATAAGNGRLKSRAIGSTQALSDDGSICTRFEKTLFNASTAETVSASEMHRRAQSISNSWTPKHRTESRAYDDASLMQSMQAIEASRS